MVLRALAPSPSSACELAMLSIASGAEALSGYADISFCWLAMAFL